MPIYFDIFNGISYIPLSILNLGNGGGGTPPPAVDQVYEVLPVNTDGQTVFALAAAITISANKTKLFVNGVKLPYSLAYTVVGGVLTYVGTDFSLKTTDKVEVYYG